MADMMTSSSEDRRQAYQLLNEGARLLHSQRVKESLPLLQDAYKLAPDDPDIAITLGGALVMAAQWSKAESFLQQAVAEHPNNARLWLNLAAAYLGRLEFSSSKRQDQAIVAFQRALELDPVAPSAHYNVGLIYAERKEWGLAAEWFQAALRANPADRDAARRLRQARHAATREGA